MLAVVAAGGSLEEITHRLTSQSEANHTSAADTHSQPEANSTAAAAAAATTNDSANSSAPLPDNIGSDVLAWVDEIEGPSDHNKADKRDVEMEDELSADIRKIDALADYDIEVTKEGEAIIEYLALLESAGSSGKMVVSQ